MLYTNICNAMNTTYYYYDNVHIYAALLHLTRYILLFLSSLSITSQIYAGSDGYTLDINILKQILENLGFNDISDQDLKVSLYYLLLIIDYLFSMDNRVYSCINTNICTYSDLFILSF